MTNWRGRLDEFRRYPGVLQALSKVAEAMCAPFWWSLVKPDNPLATILNNGTVCYLNTGSHELGITANHVLAKYLEHQNEFGDAVECQFGGSTISPEKRIIDRSSDWDLATLDVPEVFVTAAYLTQRTQHRPVTWPVQRVEVGELVVYGGYPGILRKERGRVADFPFQWMTGGVSDVSNKNIVLEPGFATVNWLNPEPGKEFNRDVGGMSGGPIFRVTEGIMRLELVGFIYGLANFGEAILGRPSDMVVTNGSIGERLLETPEDLGEPVQQSQPD